jgi:lipopolysaccharide transport system ATP-binding protein
MSTIAIRANRLGKRYYIGSTVQYKALRDSLTRVLRAPIDIAARLMGRRPSNTSRLPYWALKDVSFEIPPGEVVGIVGRNGAGKSTLLKVLSRITEPTEGSAEIWGRVGSLLEVGTGFHPELTGAENIYLSGAIHGMRRSEVEQRFDDIVQFAETEQFLQTPVKFYSSGMYMRLAFAVAAHLEPDILLVDEVLAVGDAAFQQKCLGKMTQVVKAGRTVLFVSHSMATVNELCRTGIYLDQGRVVFQGSIRDATALYSSNSEAEGRVDLETKKHAGAGQFARLLKLEVRDTAGNVSTTFEMGDTLVVRILVQCRARRKGVEIGLKISSAMGIAIHYLVSRWEGSSYDLEPGLHRFEVRMPDIRLHPGRYVLAPWISDSPYQSDDNVQDATLIEVIGKDRKGHQVLFDQYTFSGSEVYVDSHWSHDLEAKGGDV